MTRYWALGLFVAIVAVVAYLARLAWRKIEAEPVKTVDLPLWDEDPRKPHELQLDEKVDDTTPAVLSPPELAPPKAASNGSPR